MIETSKIFVDISGPIEYTDYCSEFGGIAQLGERMTGSHEVRGSIPLVSTKPLWRKPKRFFLYLAVGKFCTPPYLDIIKAAARLGRCGAVIN